MPLALMKCHIPWHLRMSHAPGTWISSHWCSPCEQSADICRSSSMGCLRPPLSIGGTVLPGWGFPSWKVSLWSLVTLAHSNTQHSMSPIGELAESSFIYWYSLYTQFVMLMHINRVTALHCLLEVRWSGTRKMLYIFVLLSAKEIDFYMTFEIRCCGAALCHLMVLLAGRLMDGW